MRKTWLFAAVALLIILAAVAVARPDRLPAVTADSSGAADNGIAANLPAVFRQPHTPTPEPTPTAEPTPVPQPTATMDPSLFPTPPPTQVPAPSPTPGFGPNLLANGSFEEGWRDLPPAPGNLTNQEPHGWTLEWLEIDDMVWDWRTTQPEFPKVGIVSGIAEMLHKIGCKCDNNGLPEDEWAGGPRALILEGVHTYKMFHRGAAFGSQLSQQVTLQPGTYRLTVPVQLHMHEDKHPDDPTWDTFTAESGAWVVIGDNRTGGWATARDMGDQRWFYHVIEFNLGAPAEVEVLIRVKSIYPGSAKDFFIDAVWLEKIG